VVSWLTVCWVCCCCALFVVQDVFEIGRRYKIMNPEKMRSEFGKLMYMLMDSADSNVQVSGAVGGVQGDRGASICRALCAGWWATVRRCPLLG